MNEYEGLNLPQLLELMYGLVMPSAVPWLPQTMGWWIAGGWLLAVLVILALRWRQWRIRNRYRREALALLSTIERETGGDPALLAEQVALLIKRTALAAYPRSNVAHLHGAEWAQFLTRSARNDPQIAQAAEQLSRAAYRADPEGAALVGPARRWIRKHRA